MNLHLQKGTNVVPFCRQTLNMSIGKSANTLSNMPTRTARLVIRHIIRPFTDKIPNWVMIFCCILLIPVAGCKKDPTANTDQNDYRLVRTLTYARSTAQEPYDISEYVHDYDGSGVPTPPSQPDHISHYNYLLFKDGLIRSQYSYANYGNGLGLESYILHFYDQAGRSSRTESYWGDGRLIAISEYIYEGGNLVRDVVTMEHEGAGHENLCFYDIHNRMVRTERRYGGNLAEYHTYSYDNLGRQTERVYYGAQDERITHVEYRYVGQQMGPIEEITTHQDQWETRLKWSYDALGNLVSSAQSIGPGYECTVLRRKYDRHRLLEETHYAINAGCTESRFVRYEYEMQ